MTSSIVAEYFYDICEIVIQQGRNVDEHNMGKMHKTLQDVSPHLNTKEFLLFQ
jgi:hypothetical protein